MPNMHARTRRTLAAVLFALGAMLLAACGSGDAAGNRATARENVVLAAGTPTCTNPSTGAATTCDKDLRGPGGGIIFYNAGSPQAWGQFLEVAPQHWNGTLYACPGSGMVGSTCGASDGIAKATSDYGANAKEDTGKQGDGYFVCSYDSTSYRQSVPLAGNAGTTGTAIGAGRTNTAVLLAAPDCTVAADPTAVSLAAGYRGGGLDDWYLPAKDELNALCAYDRRNDIGGFPDRFSYASSTAYPTTQGGKTFTSFTTVQFASKSCPMGDWGNYDPGCTPCNYGQMLVRPIRAF